MVKNSGLGRGLSSLIPSAKKEGPIAAITEGAVFEVLVSKIRKNPRQPREKFSSSELEDLMASIQIHGIIQPLVVTKRGVGEYELIAGERRLRSAEMLGLEKVPVVIRTADEQQKLELALIENLQREDLNALEEAVAYQALVNDFNLSQESVAKRMGKSSSYISNTMRLLALPEEIKKAVFDGKISRSHARALLAESDPHKQKHIFESILSGEMNVRRVELVVSSRRKIRASAGKPSEIAAAEKQLQEALLTKVKIIEKNGKGRIMIEFYSKDELKQLIADLSD